MWTFSLVVIGVVNVVWCRSCPAFLIFFIFSVICDAWSSLPCSLFFLSIFFSPFYFAPLSLYLISRALLCFSSCRIHSLHSNVNIHVSPGRFIRVIHPQRLCFKIWFQSPNSIPLSNYLLLSCRPTISYCKWNCPGCSFHETSIIWKSRSVPECFPR